MADIGTFIVCPRCGYAGLWNSNPPTVCGMDKCRCPVVHVEGVNIGQYWLKEREEREQFRDELRQKYCTNPDPKLWELRVEYEIKLRRDNEKAYAALQNQPKCPTCGTTNISRISGLERGLSVAVWGLFSKKINKTFKCNNPNCGYTW